MFGAILLGVQQNNSPANIYIYIYVQGVSLRMNPKCDLEGSFLNLILSAVSKGNEPQT